jgi:hypothetical protein
VNVEVIVAKKSIEVGVVIVKSINTMNGVNGKGKGERRVYCKG